MGPESSRKRERTLQNSSCNLCPLSLLRCLGCLQVLHTWLTSPLCSGKNVRSPSREKGRPPWGESTSLNLWMLRDLRGRVHKVAAWGGAAPVDPGSLLNRWFLESKAGRQFDQYWLDWGQRAFKKFCNGWNLCQMNFCFCLEVKSSCFFKSHSSADELFRHCY